MNYNLLDEKWIPVLYRNGKWDRVGIRQAFKDAGCIRQIAASNPMDRVAIVRFLLALLYWCKGSPPDDANADLSDSLPSDWFSKLHDNRDNFNLFGEGKRFYQCASSGNVNSPARLAADYLIHEIPTGTNKWHFRHATDKVDGLCPGCCAMGLLRLPLFSTSGGRGKPPGVNSKPPVYAVPVGVSLAETLWFSWQQASRLGTPAWEEPDLQLPTIGEVPLLMGLTWLPRRVWLGNAEEPEAACISCGRKERLVRLSVFAGIGSTKTTEGRPRRIWRDPHVLYVASPKGEVISHHASDALGAADAAADQWAKTMTRMLQSSAIGSESVRVWVVGFSTVQNDKYLEAAEYEVSFQCSPSRVRESIERMEQWQKQGYGLKRRIARSKVEGSAFVSVIRPHVEKRVSTKAGDLIAGGDEVWQQAAAEYHPLMKLIATSLSPGFTTAAVQRRLHITRVAPDMRPKTKTIKKAGRKKGGAK